MSKAFDDEFLERWLPGDVADQVTLRQQVKKLNTPNNRQLIRCVLISGESGSGKNHLARVLAAHRTLLENQGTRDLISHNLNACLNSFDEIHLPALSSDLAMSELFGHESGAFTGAGKKKLGLLSDQALSPRTDILLDEIGDASPELQARLLQAVETGRFRPVGAEPGDEEEISARLCFATNRDLAEDVRTGRFREDLYWRVTEFQLSMLPLRKQPDIIPELVSQILTQLREGLPEIMAVSQELSPDDLKWAMGYEWPGNIRELRTVLKRWLVDECRTPLRQLVSDLSHPLRGGSTFKHYSKVEFAPDADQKSLECAVKAHAQRLREAIIIWFDQTGPTDKTLEMLFSSILPSSFRQKISDWRRGNG